jgi:hypothetical protein
VPFVVGVGNEAQGERETGKHQGPRVQVGDRAPAGEADTGHAVVEVLAVGSVDRALVLQSLEHHESGVQEGDREQDQGQHKGHYDRRLDGGLNRHHPHQQAEQVRAAIAHEARGGREVVHEKAERGARGNGSEHSRFGSVEVEGNDRERAGDDHAHTRREPVHSIREVDDVHHHHEPHDGEGRPRVGGARVGEVQGAHERQRDRLDGDAEVHDHDGRRDLAGELHDWRQVEAIVERAYGGDERRCQQDAMPHLPARAEARGQEGKHCDEHPGEDRQTAEQGCGPV